MCHWDCRYGECRVITQKKLFQCANYANMQLTEQVKYAGLKVLKCSQAKICSCAPYYLLPLPTISFLLHFNKKPTGMGDQWWEQNLEQDWNLSWDFKEIGGPV